MENKKEIIKSFEQILDMLPKNLTEEESQKVEKIKEHLEKIEGQIEKEENTNRF